ncbi:hypothetical protein ABTX81_19585 [Kitasatospora sp. NPDC097605]|uniref:hypothetical protein n=1 Tax=Kitasatospora sp. NPDC097605 TaxID=3157226 RepID=UPI00331EF39E
MARRSPKREYREVVSGPSKSESNRPPADWNPLDDYRAANAAGQAPSAGTPLQIAAVRSTCTCRDCAARRTGLANRARVTRNSSSNPNPQPVSLKDLEPAE